MHSFFRFPEHELYTGNHLRYGSWPQSCQWMNISNIRTSLFLILFRIPSGIIMNMSQNENLYDCLACRLASAIGLGFICSFAIQPLPAGVPKSATLNYLHCMVHGSRSQNVQVSNGHPGNLEKECLYLCL